MLLFLLVFGAGISLFFVFLFSLFFSSRGAPGHAVVFVNDPFSDLPFFLLGEESIRSEITNPFLDSRRKNTPLIHRKKRLLCDNW